MCAGFRTGFGGDSPPEPSGQPAGLRHRLGSHVGIVIAGGHAAEFSTRKVDNSEVCRADRDPPFWNFGDSALNSTRRAMRVAMPRVNEMYCRQNFLETAQCLSDRQFSHRQLIGLICPSGGLLTGLSSLISDFPKNISVPTWPKSHLELSPSRPTEGRFAIVTKRWAGDAVDAAALGAQRDAGRVHANGL